MLARLHTNLSALATSVACVAVVTLNDALVLALKFLQALCLLFDQCECPLNGVLIIFSTFFNFQKRAVPHVMQRGDVAGRTVTFTVATEFTQAIVAAL